MQMICVWIMHRDVNGLLINIHLLAYQSAFGQLQRADHLRLDERLSIANTIGIYWNLHLYSTQFALCSSACQYFCVFTYSPCLLSVIQCDNWLLFEQSQQLALSRQLPYGIFIIISHVYNVHISFPRVTEKWLNLVKFRNANNYVLKLFTSHFNCSPSKCIFISDYRLRHSIVKCSLRIQGICNNPDL